MPEKNEEQQSARPEDVERLKQKMERGRKMEPKKLFRWCVKLSGIKKILILLGQENVHGRHTLFALTRHGTGVAVRIDVDYALPENHQLFTLTSGIYSISAEHGTPLAFSWIGPIGSDYRTKQ